MQRTGLPYRSACTEQEWFAARVAVEDRGHSTPCWIWLCSMNHKGYAKTKVRVDGAYVNAAHRLSHLWFKGPIPPQYDVDHLCHVRGCVNPDHLEAVTREENRLRSLPRHREASARRRKAFCKYGHKMEGDNLQTDCRGYRRCVECRLRLRRERYARDRAAKVAFWRHRDDPADEPCSDFSEADRVPDARATVSLPDDVCAQHLWFGKPCPYCAGEPVPTAPLAIPEEHRVAVCPRGEL